MRLSKIKRYAVELAYLAHGLDVTTTQAAELATLAEAAVLEKELNEEYPGFTGTARIATERFEARVASHGMRVNWSGGWPTLFNDHVEFEIPQE